MSPVDQSKSIKAVELARGLFEHIHGNVGLLKFSIEELKPNVDNDDKWDIVCSFYETLGSANPSRYRAKVDLSTMIISTEKIIKNDSGSNATEKKEFKIVSPEKKEANTKKV
jgi:hypothetical protein